MISKINTYFFGEAEISKSDAVWFYGVQAGALFTCFSIFLAIY